MRVRDAAWKREFVKRALRITRMPSQAEIAHRAGLSQKSVQLIRAKEGIQRPRAPSKYRVTARKQKIRARLIQGYKFDEIAAMFGRMNVDTVGAIFPTKKLLPEEKKLRRANMILRRHGYRKDAAALKGFLEENQHLGRDKLAKAQGMDPEILRRIIQIFGLSLSREKKLAKIAEFRRKQVSEELYQLMERGGRLSSDSVKKRYHSLYAHARRYFGNYEKAIESIFGISYGTLRQTWNRFGETNNSMRKRKGHIVLELEIIRKKLENPGEMTLEDMKRLTAIRNFLDHEKSWIDRGLEFRGQKLG